MQFNKLFSSILDSTIWQEPLETKVLWITMLAMADKSGEVHASIPGLAKRAGITLEQCESGLQCLLSPDPYSRTKDYDGQRITEIDGGWALLNHAKYRALLSKEERREYNRRKQAEYRSRQREEEAAAGVSITVNDSEQNAHITEAEAEAEADPNRKRERRATVCYSLGELEKCVKHLRPVEWKLPFDAQEREALASAEETLSALSKEDWRVLRAYLTEYKKPQGEPGYQPTSRIRFIQAASDVWGYASNWHAKRMRRLQAQQQKPDFQQTEQTEEDRQALVQFFNNIQTKKQ